MLDAYPGVTVLASKVALAYLKGLTHRPFTERAVKGGDKACSPGLRLHHALAFLLLHTSDCNELVKLLPESDCNLAAGRPLRC